MKGNQVKTNHSTRTHSASMITSFTIVPESKMKPSYNKRMQSDQLTATPFADR
jgi:hypothetical protein